MRQMNPGLNILHTDSEEEAASVGPWAGKNRQMSRAGQNDMHIQVFIFFLLKRAPNGRAAYRKREAKERRVGEEEDVL